MLYSIKNKVEMKKKAAVRYGIGLDISMSNFHACFSSIDEDQHVRIMATKKFNNTISGFQQLHDWINKFRKDADLPYQIFLEVTGVYHEKVLYFLHDQEHHVSLLMGKKTKAYMKSLGLDSKNDKIDSKGLSRMACERKAVAWKPVSKEILAIRTILRHRKSLIQSKNQYTNRLHALLHSANPPQEIIKSIRDTIEHIEKSANEAEMLAIKQAKLDSEFFEKVEMITYSITGMGILTILTIVAETNGFREFRSQKQLESYAGYDIIENQSGLFKGKTKISKHGNTYLRASLYMPSMSMLRFKVAPYCQLYDRLTQRNGGLGKKALVAVQRKLLVLIYTLWKKNEAFDPEHYRKWGTPKKEVVPA